jgi:hypothetical protein
MMVEEQLELVNFVVPVNPDVPVKLDVPVDPESVFLLVHLMVLHLNLMVLMVLVYLMVLETEILVNPEFDAQIVDDNSYMDSTLTHYTFKEPPPILNKYLKY